MNTTARWLLPSVPVQAAAVLLLGSNLGWRGWAPFTAALGVGLAVAGATARYGAGVAIGVSLVLAFFAFLVAYAAGVGALSWGA